MITSSLEDYLELIYNAIHQGKDLKAVDVANYFNISRSSVSEALIKLSDMDLIIYEGRRGIKLTDKGANEAKRVINKHKVLHDFFSTILGLDYNLSAKNACKIEHVVDEEVIDRIDQFSNYCRTNNISPKFLKGKYQ